MKNNHLMNYSLEELKAAVKQKEGTLEVARLDDLAQRIRSLLAKEEIEFRVREHDEGNHFMILVSKNFPKVWVEF